MATVRIGGRVLEIHAKSKAAMGDNLGYTDQTPEGIFQLSHRDSLCPRERAHVIFHELFHACGFIQGIKLNESQVVALEQFVGSLIVQNREFVEQLVADICTEPQPATMAVQPIQDMNGYIPVALNGRVS